MNVSEGSGTLVRVMYVDSLRISLPYYESVEAGFPSPADDYFEEEINLENELIQHPEATMFLRVRGNSMTGAGIFQDSVLIVDRSLPPQNGDTVIVAIDDEFTVKWYHKPKGLNEIHLLPGNPAFKPIIVREGSHSMFLLWAWSHTSFISRCAHDPVCACRL